MASLNSETSNYTLTEEFEQTRDANAFKSRAYSSLPTLSVKLVEKNYGYWRSQVLPALASHDLDGFVTGENLCPPMFHIEKSVESEERIKKPNPKYYNWKRTDQFLVSWLLSSISESMFRHVAKCTSSYEIWNTLDLHFQSFSKARTLHLRNLLQTTEKDSLNVNEYVLKMKELGDELVASGVKINDEKLLYILDGLGPEYDAVVANLTYNSRNATIQEAQFMLHKHEMRLERQTSALTSFHEQFTSALLASKQGSVGSQATGGVIHIGSHLVMYSHQAGDVGSSAHLFSQSAVGSLGIGNMGHLGNNFRKPSPVYVAGSDPQVFSVVVPPFYNNMMRGKGKGRGYFKPKLVCQVCGKTGHSALQCYHRFDHEYQGFSTPAYNQSVHVGTYNPLANSQANFSGNPIAYV